MKQGKQSIGLIIMMVFCSLSGVILGQGITKKPTRQSSLEAFSKGNYEDAYNQFRELLIIYPKDPLYKYYSGVSLVNLKRTPDEAVTMLKDALDGASVIKSLPADAFFYLGKAQQMSGRFDEAISSYNFYTREAGKKKAKDLDVPSLIQQCRNKEGKLNVTQIKLVPEVKPEPALDAGVKPASDIQTAESGKNKVLSSDYENILDDAVGLQAKADSLNNLAAEQRNELVKLTGSEKAAMTTKISDNESLAIKYQKAADGKYSQAQAVMNTFQNTEVPSAGDALVNRAKVEAKDTTIKEVSREVSPVPDSTDKKMVNIPEKQMVQEAVAVGPSMKPVEKDIYFDVLPSPVKDSDEKIVINPDVPDGLIYRIQVAVFRNQVSPSYFKGIIPVFGFSNSSSGMTTYYAGMFRRLSDASRALTSVRSKGFRDAFVVAFSGIKRISSDRARILEKEWGNKPFIDLVPIVQETKADTLPPALSFRIAVARTEKPLKDDVTENLIKIAASRGMDILTLNDGSFVYLIGNFITFESASEYADLLVRNGFQDSKVSAWLGNKEIPVQTARELFNSLK